MSRIITVHKISEIYYLKNISVMSYYFTLYQVVTDFEITCMCTCINVIFLCLFRKANALTMSC